MLVYKRPALNVYKKLIRGPRRLINNLFQLEFSFAPNEIRLFI